MDIAGKVFIVTGGASGLGEGTARIHNKELKLTKPGKLRLRSLTPVFDGPWADRDER